jgi:hypothetical protein
MRGENGASMTVVTERDPYDPGATIIQPELPDDDRGFDRGVCEDYQTGGTFSEDALMYAYRRVKEHTNLVENHGRDLVADAVRHKLMATET